MHLQSKKEDRKIEGQEIDHSVCISLEREGDRRCLFVT